MENKKYEQKKVKTITKTIIVLNNMNKTKLQTNA